MKHLLNNLSEEEKNRIREQHTGGMNIFTKKFNKLSTEKSGNVKPLINEQESEINPQSQTEVKTVVNKVASEGIKNVTPEMMSSPQFKGDYSGYVFGGTFNGVKYDWDCNGVDGMSGIRGMVVGEIISETVENMFKAVGKSMTDGKPGTPCVGFYSSNSKFLIYTTTSGKPKCVYF